MLEWLGDIGGLFDALRYIGAFLLYPLVSFKLQSQILSSNFSYVESLANKKEKLKAMQPLDSKEEQKVLSVNTSSC